MGRSLVLLLASVAFLLGAAEALVAVTRVDSRILAPLLYYQGQDVAVHRVSNDVVLHYELRPGASARFQDTPGGPERTVTIDPFGFRGAAHPRKKGPSV